MRTFIGIDFDDEVKSKISDLQSRLKGMAKSGRWKRIDNFHLTLKFLGEVDKSLICNIAEKLDEVCKNMNKFTLRIEHLGAFSAKECTRVVWLGIGGETSVLKSLQKNIEDKLLDLNFEKESREYTPHITIGQDVYFNENFNEIKKSFDDFFIDEIMVEKIHLFKSEQIGRLRVYTSLKQFPLK